MISIYIQTDSAAFDDGNKGFEVARILREMANTAESGDYTSFVADINGNFVGEMVETDEEGYLQ
jgi:hypothetical protein